MKIELNKKQSFICWRLTKNRNRRIKEFLGEERLSSVIKDEFIKTYGLECFEEYKKEWAEITERILPQKAIKPKKIIKNTQLKPDPDIQVMRYDD